MTMAQLPVTIQGAALALVLVLTFIMGLFTARRNPRRRWITAGPFDAFDILVALLLLIIAFLLGILTHYVLLSP